MKIRFLLLIITFNLGGEAMSQDFLSSYKWKNRVIILLSSVPENDMLDQQCRILDEFSPGVKERDLVIVSNQADSTGDNTKRSIEKKFDIPDTGFRFILIGKDGTVKMDRTEQVSAEELFAIIDAMPMRRREMKDQNR